MSHAATSFLVEDKIHDSHTFTIRDLDVGRQRLLLLTTLRLLLPLKA